MKELSLSQVQSMTSDILKAVDSICKRHSITYYLAYGTALGSVRHQGPIPWDYDMDLIVPAYDFDRFFKVMRSELPSEYYLDYRDITKHYCFVFPRIGLSGYATDEVHVDVFKIIGVPNDEEERKMFLDEILKVRSAVFYKNRKINPNLRSIIGRGIYKLKYLFTSNKSLEQKIQHYSYLYPIENSKYVVDTNAHIQNGINEQFLYRKEIFGEPSKGVYNGFEVYLPGQVDEYLTIRYGDYMQLPPERERVYKDKYILYERTKNI